MKRLIIEFEMTLKLKIISTFSFVVKKKQNTTQAGPL